MILQKLIRFACQSEGLTFSMNLNTNKAGSIDGSQLIDNYNIQFAVNHDLVSIMYLISKYEI